MASSAVRSKRSQPKQHLRFVDTQIDGTEEVREMAMTMPRTDITLVVDFKAMARAYPTSKFAAKLKECGGEYLDFQDPEVVRELAITTLRHYFHLKLDIPSNRLCPAIPVRYEYIRWLQILLDTTNGYYDDVYDPNRAIVGIDIGVGSSCIYPLLGCATRESWTFHGTEIDDDNFYHAEHNINENDLNSRIKVSKTDPKGPIIDMNRMGITRADFLMCNPPFFFSKEDMLDTYRTKKKSPSAICRGADVEMITEGGDLGFIMRIVEESLEHREKIQWYSSMFGKLEGVSKVVAALKGLGVTNWAVTTFRAGEKTRRWALAWSFGGLRPRIDVARGDTHIPAALPFPTERRLAVPASSAAKVPAALAALAARWTWDPTTTTGTFFSAGDVWSRAARRLRRRVESEGVAGGAEVAVVKREVGGEGFVVRVVVVEREERAVVRWLAGGESVVFESFVGWLGAVVG